MSKLLSKISTLDAAKQIYYIIVGLALKDALILLAGSKWGSGVVIVLAYVITLLRYTHGVALLYGAEKREIESTSTPSALRITFLSASTISLGASFFLMGSSLSLYESGPYVKTGSGYLWYCVVISVVDFLMLWLSGLLPSIRFWQNERYAVKGYAPHAAIRWAWIDIIQIIAAILVVFIDVKNGSVVYGVLLVVLGVMDYSFNAEYFFGGAPLKRRRKFVYVDNVQERLDRSGMLSIMWHSRRLYDESQVPFSPSLFYSYLLDNAKVRERAVAVQCSAAFLRKCDCLALIGLHDRFWKCTNDYHSLDNRLRTAPYGLIALAGMHGLPVRYLRTEEPFWIDEVPEWKEGLFRARDIVPLTWDNFTLSASIQNSGDSDYASANEPELSSVVYGGQERRRVYVCTQLKGIDFDKLSVNERVARLQENISYALYQCRCLALDPECEYAPFAPHAFYPYFLGNEIWENDGWKKYNYAFLKACDEVHVYSKSGISITSELSMGMRYVIDNANKLGIVVKYRHGCPLPSNWDPALPSLGFINEHVEEDNVEVVEILGGEGDAR